MKLQSFVEMIAGKLNPSAIGDKRFITPIQSYPVLVYCRGQFYTINPRGVWQTPRFIPENLQRYQNSSIYYLPEFEEDVPDEVAAYALDDLEKCFKEPTETKELPDIAITIPFLYAGAIFNWRSAMWNRMTTWVPMGAYATKTGLNVYVESGDWELSEQDFALLLGALQDGVEIITVATNDTLKNVRECIIENYRPFTPEVPPAMEQAAFHIQVGQYILGAQGLASTDTPPNYRKGYKRPWGKAVTYEGNTTKLSVSSEILAMWIRTTLNAIFIDSTNAEHKLVAFVDPRQEKHGELMPDIAITCGELASPYYVFSRETREWEMAQEDLQLDKYSVHINTPIGLNIHATNYPPLTVQCEGLCGAYEALKDLVLMGHDTDELQSADFNRIQQVTSLSYGKDRYSIMLSSLSASDNQSMLFVWLGLPQETPQFEFSDPALLQGTEEPEPESEPIPEPEPVDVKNMVSFNNEGAGSHIDTGGYVDVTNVPHEMCEKDIYALLQHASVLYQEFVEQYKDMPVESTWEDECINNLRKPRINKDPVSSNDVGLYLANQFNQLFTFYGEEWRALSPEIKPEVTHNRDNMLYDFHIAYTDSVIPVSVSFLSRLVAVTVGSLTRYRMGMAYLMGLENGRVQKKQTFADVHAEDTPEDMGFEGGTPVISTPQSVQIQEPMISMPDPVPELRVPMPFAFYVRTDKLPVALTYRTDAGFGISSINPMKDEITTDVWKTFAVASGPVSAVDLASMLDALTGYLQQLAVQAFDHKEELCKDTVFGDYNLLMGVSDFVFTSLKQMPRLDGIAAGVIDCPVSFRYKGEHWVHKSDGWARGEENSREVILWNNELPDLQFCYTDCTFDIDDTQLNKLISDLLPTLFPVTTREGRFLYALTHM